MADEVSAALLGEMRAALALKTETDARIGAIRKKLTAKTATQADIADYSDRLGELLRDTLRETLTPEALPNETLYYNILRDTVGVMLKNAHRKVNEAAIEAQKVIDEAQGLHLNAESAPYPQKRADDLFYKVGAPGTPYETAMKRLAEPVATLTRAFHDDHIRHNADARFRAGMRPKIVRTAHFNCCEWCSSLAGTYDYEDVRDTGNDVFRRHERCKCTVDYVCDGKKQDVWSKKLYEADDATLERRETYRASTGDAFRETLQARTEYGLDQHRKTPEEMQAEYDRLQEKKGLAKAAESGIIKEEAHAASLDKISKTGARSVQTISHGFSVFPDGDELTDYSTRIVPKKEFYDVAMHGNPESVGFASKKGNMTPHELAEFIRHRPDYNGKDSIRLLSCSTGKAPDSGEPCFAAELATALGVTVEAPNDVLIIYNDGTFIVGYHGEGAFLPFKPNERGRLGARHKKLY